MMATRSYGEGNLSIGRVFGTAFGTIAANPLTTLGIALMFSAVPGQLFRVALRPLFAGVAASRDPSAFGELTSGAIGIAIASFGVTIVLAMVTQGALVRVTLAHAAGRIASIGESLSAGLAVVLPLIGLAIVSWFAMTLASLLLVVPGIILFVMWTVATPALVEERVGIFGALGRSRALTKGSRWRIFGLIAVLLVGYWVILGVAGFLAILLNGGVPVSPLVVPSIPVLIFNALMGTVTAAIWATVTSALYVELLGRGGPGAEDLADVFA